MSLTKSKLVQIIHQNLGIANNQASDIFEDFISIVKNTLESGEDVKIAGFGKFEVKQKRPRRGRNPQTGESLMIDGRQIVTFKPSNLLRDQINGGK